MLRVTTGVATGYYFWSTILCENVVYIIIILSVKTRRQIFFYFLSASSFWFLFHTNHCGAIPQCG